jgi:hypothetical protein
MNELGQRSGRSLRPSPRQAGQARSNGLRLLEPEVWHLAA